MEIDREKFDRQPLLIRQGAVKLWGVPLAHRSDFCRTRKLFKLDSFFAEVCYSKENGQLTCICTTTQLPRLHLYADQLSMDESGISEVTSNNVGEKPC
jgi:hypothetical protein